LKIVTTAKIKAGRQAIRPIPDSAGIAQTIVTDMDGNQRQQQNACIGRSVNDHRLVNVTETDEGIQANCRVRTYHNSLIIFLILQFILTNKILLSS